MTTEMLIIKTLMCAAGLYGVVVALYYVGQAIPSEDKGSFDIKSALLSIGYGMVAITMFWMC